MLRHRLMPDQDSCYVMGASIMHWDIEAERQCCGTASPTSWERIRHACTYY